MNRPELFGKREERTFFAHHILLHAALLEIQDAETGEKGRFNKCLAAMAMMSLAIEALANAVGSKVADDWDTFERLSPHDKVECLVSMLHISLDKTQEPWTTLQFLFGFRNDIAHPKPESVVQEKVLPEPGLATTAIGRPLSVLERQITLGNAKRSYDAVNKLKSMLTDALPVEHRFGIYADMWSGSTSVA